MNQFFKLMLLGLAAITLIVLIFSAWVVYQLRDSEAYQAAVQQLITKSEIQRSTGGIEELGWYVEGFVRQQSLRDTANFILWIEGKHQDVEVFCQMGKDENSRWALKGFRILGDPDKRK